MLLFSRFWSLLSSTEPPTFCTNCAHPCSGRRENQRVTEISLSAVPGKEGYRAISEHKEGPDSLEGLRGQRFKCLAPINANVSHRGLFLLP